LSNYSPSYQKLSKIAIQRGISINFGGEQAKSNEANVALLEALPMYLTLLTGCLVAPFGFISLLGLLVLMSTVVNNGIVLIDRMLFNMKKGPSLNQSVVNTFTMRFHAALLTVLITSVSMLPVTVSTSPLWPTLALTTIGGLLYSTLPTLVVISYCAKLICSSKFIKRFQE
jgi:multidrug efflux pump subunit AcrB